MNTNTCPNCGKPLDPGALGGLCPACMAGVGLGTQTLEPAGDDPAGGGPRFTPPTPEQLSPHFPQLEILSLLGQGGMGAVYKARQRHLDRMVALKILPPTRQDPAFSERFEREAKALAKLNHPNIVTLYEFGQADGFFYLLMEFVDGMNLGQVLRAGKLSPEEALAIVPHICDALQYAHDRGIVHRDIKPENILLGKEGAVKIADFGVAKIVAGSLVEPTPGTSAQVQPELTEAGRVLGTPRYMAPEQASSPLQVDHRADIYSLGVVFYQMLTGELPAGKLEPPSRKVQIDVRLDEVVLRAMEKEPSLRYQQASEVKTEVETIAGTAGSSGIPPYRALAADVDYRSRATLFGLPLLHVAMGIDPATGRKRVARGIFALGDIAVGGVAMGGIAVGVIAVGGLAAGGVALGGLGIAFIALAGMAIGLIAAFGGSAIAPVALGGEASGWWAWAGNGGTAHGIHAIGMNRHDLIAQQFFGHWAANLSNSFWIVQVTIVPILLIIGIGVPLLLKRRAAGQAKRPQSVRANQNPVPVMDFAEALAGGDYGRAWDKAAPYFQNDQSRDEWIARMEKERRPLGKTVDSKPIAITTLTPTIRFATDMLTTFENDQQRVEGFVSAVQSNGEQRVEKYYLKPASSEAIAKARANAEPNPWQPVIAIVGVILCTAGSIAAFAVPFPASAIVFVLASTGVAVSLLRLAGFWPWRSPMFPHSNWASRNLQPGPHWRLRKVLLLVALVVLIPLWIHVLFVLLIYSSNQVAPGKHPSVNAPSPSGLMSSSVGSNQPLVTQKGVTELQPDGIVRIKVTVDFVNQTGQPVETNHFLNGDSVHVEKIYDAKGRPLIFQAKPRKGDHIDYNLVFNEPVPPGGMISYTTEGTITGLIKATDEPNVFKFHYMNRWPANSRVSFSERYRLPPGAKLIDKSPEDLKQETVGDHIELTIDQLIPRGGYIEVNFRYRLANTQNTSQLKTFGPVIERELTEENGIIAFDTGEVVKLPESVQKMNGFGESIAAAATWLERHKMDAVYSAAELDGFNMKVRPLKGEEWDTLTPGELKQMVDAIDLDRQPTFRMTTEENGPSTYAFQTREGGMGIAQILGYMTDKEGSKVGMKIRYKLLQNAALSADAASQPDSSASAHPSAAPTQTPSSQPNQDGALKNRAADFVDLLAAGKFADATDQFAGVMRKALPETKLAGLWHDLGGSGGKYLGHDPVTRVEKSGEYFCVYVPCRWERARVDLKVVFDSAGKISGLWEAAPENAGAPGEPVQPRTEAEKNALAAALPWLAANDAGDYSKSWKESAAIVRSSVTESGWNLTMGMSRKPLGNLVSRRLKFVQSMKSPPNAPEGDYVVMQFDTAFTAGNVVETVTFVLEADGQWRAAGYFLK